MSQENVEPVVALSPAPDVDLAQLFRNDDIWAAANSALAPLFHPDFECNATLLGPATTYAGVDGFRAFCLDLPRGEGRPLRRLRQPRRGPESRRGWRCSA